MARTQTKEMQEIERNSEDQRSCALYVGDPLVYQVEKILDVRGGKAWTEYLIKFKGYTSNFNEWVAAKNVTPDVKRAFSREQKQKEVKRLQEDRAKGKKKIKSSKKQNATIASKHKSEPVESSRKESDGVKMECAESSNESMAVNETMQQSSDQMDGVGVSLELKKSSEESMVVNVQQVSDEMDLELDKYVSKLLKSDSEPYLLGFNEFLEPVLTFDQNDFELTSTQLKKQDGSDGSEFGSIATLLKGKTVQQSTDQMDDDPDSELSTLIKETEGNLLGFDGLDAVFE